VVVEVASPPGSCVARSGKVWGLAARHLPMRSWTVSKDAECRCKARGEDPAGGTGEGAVLNELMDDVCKLLVSILCGARGGWRG